MGCTTTARVAVVVGKGEMVGGGEDFARARLVVVSSAREESTWEMAVEAVSMAREATSEGGGADVVSTASVAKSDVGMVAIGSVEVTTAGVAASEAGTVVAGVLDVVAVVAVDFWEAMSSRTLAIRSGSA